MRKLGAQLSKITMEMRPVEMRPVVTRDKQCGGACSYVVRELSSSGFIVRIQGREGDFESSTVLSDREPGIA